MALSSELFPATRTTPLPGGYMGKMLRVDMTSGSLQDENLPEEPVLKKFISWIEYVAGLVALAINFILF